jgi:transcriptional regulator GlxA family with amidase domain
MITQRATLQQVNGFEMVVFLMRSRRLKDGPISSSTTPAADLGERAGRLFVSERTLNRRFKRAIGEPPLQYLQTLRVEVAKQLLESKRLPVESIAERVGYNDLSTFRRLFKRETGLTPRDYRRRFSRLEVA